MSSRYDPKAVEAKWQERWERQRAAEVDLRHAEGKEYLLVEAGPGSEQGGPGRADIAGDALFRYRRMAGRRVLSPAVKGRKEQLRRLGILHDWTKGVDPRAPEVYRWTQWLFLRLFEKGLAYEEGGRWYFRVSASADRLLAGLDALPGWPERIKAAQRHWLTTHRRDWLVSSREGGGTPVPLVACPKHGTLPVPDSALPVVLPPHGGANKAEAPCPRCGKPARRATSTLDAGVESAWIYLRHLSPRDASHLVDPEVARRWMPVDRLLCGAGGRMLPLLHARFLCRALHGLGAVAVEEPFARLLIPGRVTRTAEADDNAPGTSSADAQRLAMLSLAPLEKDAEWDGEAVAGAYRFLLRVWRTAAGLQAAPPTAPADGDLERRRHAAVERVTRSLERAQLNTAVAALRELENGLSQALEGQTASRLRCEETFDTLLQLLHPLAPHITEELWERRDHVETLLDTTWPEYDEGKLRRPRIQLAVQVDGRLRQRIEADAGADEKEARAAALAGSNVKKHLAGREVAKAVFVPGRLINLVTRRSA
jgi:leucyl-tRNA synthetase